MTGPDRAETLTQGAAMKCPQCGASVETPAAGTRARCRYCSAELQGPPEAAADPLGGFFADRDGNGIPDVMDGLMKQTGGAMTVHQSSSTYVVNGVHYGKLEEVPTELRAMLQRTQGMLDGLEGGAVTPAAPPSMQARTEMRPAAPGSRLWIVIAVAAAFVAGIAVVLWLQ